MWESHARIPFHFKTGSRSRDNCGNTPAQLYVYSEYLPVKMPPMDTKEDVREESDEEFDSGVEAVPGIDDDLVIGVALLEFALFKIVIPRVALLALFDRE